MSVQPPVVDYIPLPEADAQVLQDMADVEINRTAHAVKAMAHPLRLKLLCLLGTEELSVQDLTDKVRRTSQSNISQHLAHMLERRILENRKAGNQVFYRIKDSRVLSLIIAMKAVFCPGSH